MKPVAIVVAVSALVAAFFGGGNASAQSASWLDGPPGTSTSRPTCPSVGQWVLLYWSGQSSSVDRTAAACSDADRIWSNRSGRWYGFDPSSAQASDAWTVETGEAHFLHASCLSSSSVGRLWPPAGSVSYPTSENATAQAAVTQVPFSQVQVLAVGCANMRGAGADAYVAYSAPVAQAPDGRVTGLAVVNRRDNSFVNVGGLPTGSAPTTIAAKDLTGDGRDELIYTTAGGASFTTWSVWSWQTESYVEVFDGGSYLAPARIQDIDRDGKQEIVTYSRYPANVTGAQWPTAYRWNGTAYTPYLAPQLFNEFIDRAKSNLESGAVHGKTEVEIALHSALGQAYQLQGRKEDAASEYRAAWILVPLAAPPRTCTGLTDAVAAYYADLNSGDLYLAYQIVSVAQPFWDWAPAFAPVTSVRLLEAQQPSGQSADAGSVATTIAISWLTPTGERQQEVAGTLDVTRTAQSCTIGSWQPSALSGIPTP